MHTTNTNDQFKNYEQWKANPEGSVVLDVEKLSAMIGWHKHATYVAIQALLKAFEDKEIILIGDLPIQTEQHNTIREEKPTLTVLSWVPGAGKSTFAEQKLTENSNIVKISNDALRAALTGLTEADINEKIRNTTIETEEWEKNMETFANPNINIAKNALIEGSLKNNYDVIVDAVHPKAFMWDDFHNKYNNTANIEHTLLLPNTLRNAIKKAAERIARPESKYTITKVWGRLKELTETKDDNENPKYKFDHIFINNYENGGFQDKTAEFYNKKTH